MTALVEGDNPGSEATELQISTIADNWIQLSYLVRGGERNRALTIVKCRGTRHSNQVRELILSDQGVALADVYSSGGEVLMGTLRWEKEVEEKSRALLRETESANKRRELQFVEAVICPHRRPATRSRKAPRRPRPRHARRCGAERFARRKTHRSAQIARCEWNRHRDTRPRRRKVRSAASPRRNCNVQERSRRGQ